MHVRRPWRLAVLVVAGLAVLLVLYAGWLVWRAESALSSTADDARSLKTAVVAGDPTRIHGAADRFESDAHHARSLTGGPMWSLLTHLPIVGDDAHGVRTVAEVADGLGSDGLDELAASAGHLGDVVPAHGRIDLEELSRLQAPVAQGTAAMQRASAQLHAQDGVGYSSALRSRYRDVETQIDQATGALGTVGRALQVLPQFLGQDHPADTLLVFYNNAEIRSGGGLPGAVSLLHADRGALSVTRQAAGSTMKTGSPVRQLTTPEKELFGPQLGDYFVDANMTPDFDRTADLMRAHWTKAYGGHLDGVIALDPVTLSYLMKATGPVTVDGHRITSATAVGYLLHQVYVDYPRPADQDVFFAEVARQVFSSVTDGRASPMGVLRALARGASERRVFVHAFAPATQRQITGTAVAGDLPATATSTPQVGFFIDDTTGSKMSYYLRYDTSVTSTYCTGGVQGLTAHATVSSVAPADAAKQPAYITGGGKYGVPPGWELVTAYVFAPVGGTLGQFTVDGEKQNYGRTTFDGRTVATTYLWLKPGRTFDLTWTMTTGRGQTGQVRMQTTPSVVPGGSSSWAPSSCG